MGNDHCRNETCGVKTYTMKRKTINISITSASQTASLSKEYRFDKRKSCKRKEAHDVIFASRPDSWHDFFHSDLRPTADFMAERIDLPNQKR